MQEGAGLLKYVKCHIHLGQTFGWARLGAGSLALAKAAHGSQLSFERGFKRTED